MRSGAKAALVGGVFAVMLGGAGYGAYNLVNGVTGGSSAQAAPVRTGPPTKTEIRETADKFLAAWAKGDASAAAAYTNNSADARAVLEDYSTEAYIKDVKLTPGEAAGAKVSFSVSATVSYEGVSKPLAYKSELTVVRGLTTKKPLVDWEPSLVHPKLEKGDTLRAGEADLPKIKAVDVKGRALTAQKYPSLGPVLADLRQRYGDTVEGTPGTELWIERAGDSTPDTTLVTLSRGKPGQLRTTLDADVQAAAERQVERFGESSVVAVKPSTGEIRAVANNRQDGYNAAMQGEIAPGSTMKIVTAAMLIDNGLVTADGPSQCTPYALWYGAKFTNLNGFSDPGVSFARSFARSCNTAFIKPITELGDRDDTALGTTAKQYFGIGLTWKTGVKSFDGDVPASTQAETAASYIGQGRLRMNPLTIASITATAKSGTFKQPVLLKQLLDDPDRAKARPLPVSTAQQLRQMMRLAATASYGTGTQVMASVGGDKGAKTGSAEVDGATSDSWFTAYSDDLAAAAVVRAGGHGGDAAGPLVASVLRAG